MEKPYLSIVIPAHNEEQRIGITLEAVHTFVSRQPYTTEVLVVDDGSRDQTAEIVNTLSNAHKCLRVLQLPENQGKGAAVRTGMLSAQGKYRLFMDADNSTSISHATDMLVAAEAGADVVVGSRHIPGSVIITKQHILRETLGFIFRILTRAIAPTGVRDTQNGFKLFKTESAEMLFATLVCPRWAFDVEILRRARGHGLVIVEVPVTWINDTRSKMHYSHMFSILLDSIAIARRTYKP
jgi:dolichyl-phosphate beta-glucosyltransferase